MVLKTIVKVLLVEDGKEIIKIVKIIFFGYKPLLEGLPDVDIRLTVAEDFNEAIEKSGEAYDLVLLDNRMPRTSGGEEEYIGYRLFDRMKSTGALVVGTSSDKVKNPPPFDFIWNKSSLKGWDELYAMIKLIADKKRK